MASASSKTRAEARRLDARPLSGPHAREVAQAGRAAILPILLLILSACAHGPAQRLSPEQQLSRLEQTLPDPQRTEPPVEASKAARTPFPPAFAAEQGAYLDPDQYPLSRRGWQEFAQAVDLPLFWSDDLRPLMADAPVDQALPGEAWPDPPVEAQRWYARARIAAHHRDMEQAVGAIRQAVALAPDDPAILAHAAEIEDAVAPGSVRAMDMLRRSLTLDPLQPDVLYLMARRISQQRRWEEVPALLRPAFRLADARGQNTLASLSAYFLAMSLERTGYELLAAEMYRQSLGRRPAPGEGARYRREFQLLQQQRMRTWQTLGDLELRLGRPGRAWLDYRQALAEAETESDPAEDESASARLLDPDTAGLHARMLFALIWLGEHDAAWQTAMTFLDQQQADDGSLDLARWLGERVRPPADITQSMIRLYDRLDQPRPMLDLLADILPQPDAVPLLEACLDEHPDDRELFRRWLVILVTDRQPYLGRVRQDRMPYICHRVVGWIDQSPGLLADYSDDLFAVAWGPGPVLDAIDRMSDRERGGPVLQALEGLALAAGTDHRRAVEPLQAAVNADPRLTQAVRQAAASALAIEDYPQVIALLEPWFAGPTDQADVEPDADDLARLAEAMKEAEQDQQRVQLLRAVSSRTSEPLVASTAARLLGEEAGHREEAIGALLALRQQHPAQGEIHRDLINLLAVSQEHGMSEQLPDRDAAVRQMLRDAGESLMVRSMQIFFGEIENSQYERAQRNLRPLVAEYAGQRPSLVNMFLMTLFVLDRVDEMDQYARDLLIDYPFSPELRALAISTLDQAGHRRPALDLYRRLAEAMHPGPEQAERAARLELEAGRPDRARRLLQPWLNHAMARHVEQAVAATMVVALARSRGVDAATEWIDRRLAVTEDEELQHSYLELHADLLEAAGRWDEARALLGRSAEQYPDHVRFKLRQVVFLIYAEGDPAAAQALGRQIDAGEHNGLLELLMAQADLLNGEITAASDRLNSISRTSVRQSAPFQKMLGDLAALSGDSTRALQHYRRALWVIGRPIGHQPLSSSFAAREVQRKIQLLAEGNAIDQWQSEPWRQVHALPDRRRLMEPYQP